MFADMQCTQFEQEFVHVFADKQCTQFEQEFIHVFADMQCTKYEQLTSASSNEFWIHNSNKKERIDTRVHEGCGCCADALASCTKCSAPILYALMASRHRMASVGYSASADSQAVQAAPTLDSACFRCSDTC